MTTTSIELTRQYPLESIVSRVDLKRAFFRWFVSQISNWLIVMFKKMADDLEPLMPKVMETTQAEAKEIYPKLTKRIARLNHLVQMLHEIDYFESDELKIQALRAIDVLNKVDWKVKRIAFKGEIQPTPEDFKKAISHLSRGSIESSLSN